MDRRRFLGMMGGAGAASLALPRLQLKAQPGPDGWNVLMIILEDLNTWLGCLGGHPDTITPNIDAFAASGVLFTNAYANSPACNPSRTAFFSGLHPSTTGCLDNDTDWRPLLPVGHKMLPQRFVESGYRSVRIGKGLHGGFDIPSFWHEKWYGSRPQDISGYDPYLPNHPNDDMPVQIAPGDDWHWGPTDANKATFFDRKMVALGNARLNTGFDSPFFMVLGSHKTHYPWIAPREYFERFSKADIHLPVVNENDLTDIPPAGQAYAETYRYTKSKAHKAYRDAVHSYLATIHYLDDTLGIFLDEFNQRPEAQNTIVVMMADHGHHVGEKLHMRKKTLWEEATRSLLAIRVPGMTQPGGVCSTPVGLMDVYATLVELCDLPPMNSGVDSVSLVPQLIDPTTPRDFPVLMSYEQDNHAVVDDRWRYIRYYDGSEELYDHLSDPREWTNLAGDPEYDTIKAQLATWMPPLPGNRRMDDWRFQDAIRSHRAG